MSVAIGDLGGDQWPDLAVGNYSQHVTSLYHQRERRPGDVDDDGDVHWLDLFALLVVYGACEGDPQYHPNADVDGNGCVTLSDLAELLANYGAGAQRRVSVPDVTRAGGWYD